MLPINVFRFRKTLYYATYVLLIYDLLKEGYDVFIIETEEFIRNVKVVKDLVSDFGNKVKFYKKGTTPKGVYIKF